MIMLFSIVCLCATFILAVTSNPILQPCPVCPQNGPMSNQASNYHPYQQVNMAQNPTPYCSNYQHSNDGNTKNLMNKLLSNPTIRLMLDPNTKLINQDGVEVPRGPSNGNQPAVINNYIIIPPEVFTNGTKSKNKKPVRNGRRRHRNDKQKTVAKDIKTNDDSNIEKLNKTIAKDINTNEDLNTENLGRTSFKVENSTIIITNTLDTPNNNTTKSIDDTETDNENAEVNEKLQQRLGNRKRMKNQENNNNTEPLMEEQKATNTSVRNNDTTELNNSLMQNYTAYKDNARRNNYKHYEQVMKAYNTSKTHRQNVLINETQDVNSTDTSNFLNQTNGYTATKELAKLVENYTETNKTENINVENGNKSGKIVPKEIIVTLIKTDPKEEAMIHEFRKKYPGIPENQIRNLLSNMRDQLKNDMSTSTNPPTNQVNKDQISNKTRNPERNRNNHRRKNGRRPNNRKRKNGNRMNNRKNDADRPNTNKIETTIETNAIAGLNYNNNSSISHTDKPQTTTTNPSTIKTTPQGLDTTHIPETTTEVVSIKPPISESDESKILNEPTTIKDTLILENTLNVSTKEPIIEKVNEKYPLETKSEAYNFIETTTFVPLKPKADKIDDFSTENTIPALGDEDVVPVMELNGIIDEYYPDFTRDAIAYLESNEELNVNHKITDFATRHHYTTDKNYELQEYFSKRQHSNEDNGNINGHVQISKFDNYEDTGARPYIKDEFESEELDFKTPPILDMPDFETKPINKNHYRNDEDYSDKYYEKVSSYSDAKAAQYNYDDKPNAKRSSGNSKLDSNKNVETHFARSKVVKYGQNAKLPHDDLDKIFDSSEHTALIFATSYQE